MAQIPLNMKTPTEAQKLICPFLGGSAIVTCFTTGCMAWRTAYQRESDGLVVRRQIPGEREFRLVGWCGAAGDPQS